jgi:hypothetical protein
MKTIWRLASAGVIAAALLAPTIGTAAAGGGDWNWKHHHHGGGGGWDAGGAILGGAVLGLTIGALANPYYGPPPPAYYAYPPPPPPYPSDYTEDHIAWCSATYHSYNAETDTFIGFDGYAHRCVDPY